MLTIGEDNHTMDKLDVSDEIDYRPLKTMQ